MGCVALSGVGLRQPNPIKDAELDKDTCEIWNALFDQILFIRMCKHIELLVYMRMFVVWFMQYLRKDRAE